MVKAKRGSQSFDKAAEKEIENFCDKFMNYNVLRQLDGDVLRRGEAKIAMVSCKFREFLAIRERQSSGGLKKNKKG